MRNRASNHVRDKLSETELYDVAVVAGEAGNRRGDIDIMGDT